MNDEFRTYFRAIGMTDVLIRRAEEVFGFYSQVCPEEIGGVFVEEYLNEDGARQYGSLWFFSCTYVMEARQFVTKDDFDLAIIRERGTYWKVEKQDYDFVKASEKSRLRIHLSIGQGSICDLKASKENCDYLRDVFITRFMPNMMTK